MAAEEEDKDTRLSSVKYYVLNDKNAGTFYDEWKFKTLAIIRKKGWGSLFEDRKPKVPTKTEVNTAGATAKDKELYKANLKAYDQILMGCSGISLGLVKRANGSATEAMEKLDKKYAKKSKEMLTEILTEFIECKLENTSADPDKWFINLDTINDRLESIGSDYRKKEYELKAHLLSGLPKGYEDVKTKIRRVELKYTVEDIEDKIRTKWASDFR